MPPTSGSGSVASGQVEDLALPRGARGRLGAVPDQVEAVHHRPHPGEPGPALQVRDRRRAEGGEVAPDEPLLLGGEHHGVGQVGGCGGRLGTEPRPRRRPRRRPGAPPHASRRDLDQGQRAAGGVGQRARCDLGPPLRQEAAQLGGHAGLRLDQSARHGGHLRDVERAQRRAVQGVGPEVLGVQRGDQAGQQQCVRRRDEVDRAAHDRDPGDGPVPEARRRARRCGTPPRGSTARRTATTRSAPAVRPGARPSRQRDRHDARAGAGGRGAPGSAGRG